MKELEKTKRISIATTLFILAVLIGLFTFKRPKNTFVYTSQQTLKILAQHKYLASISEISDTNNVLIDIRNTFEFEKGSLNNAINIQPSEFLSEENLNLFKTFKKENKTVLLFGNNPEEVNLPYLLLSQLGYDNIKLLTLEIKYIQNNFFTKNSPVETYKNDINAFINESLKNSGSKIINKPKPKKKRIVVRQKKKKTAEGGC
ncbi:rhodanese-like domain-containing protein [Polaribacter sp. Z022]|uniref:rhodanese-like domain-containing protein n=1 Tax=Polaribacter sp. Z022 TaxID=2927125 RepID=UPI00201FD391|nr:rhodanese-like domain-containing protein [Polaribacter sp. Z022]MCL7752612.1 rhodanese-like domain-containing protein [Polaribacter sp. Z022]